MEESVKTAIKAYVFEIIEQGIIICISYTEFTFKLRSSRGGKSNVVCWHNTDVGTVQRYERPLGPINILDKKSDVS